MTNLCSHCDNVVTLSTPEPFVAVGRYYSDFDQTTDEQVVAAMRESANFAPLALPQAMIGAKTG